MQLRYLMAASALVAFVGLASPAMANDNNKHNDNSSVSKTQGGSAAAAGNGKSTVQGNGDNRGNTTTNSNGNNRDNVAVTTGDNNLGGLQANGNNRDNESMGNGSASKGGTVSDNGDNRDNGGNTTFGNGAVVADQALSAVVVGHDERDLVDNVDGYKSGDQSINGNAFAAYAGILTQAWNTGIAANTQAGTNIAATGNVNFSSAGGDQANGKGGDTAN